MFEVFMEIEIGITFVLLIALLFLATVDMAFGELSDVGLRRLITEAEGGASRRAVKFLNEILENRSRFRFTLTAIIQILLIIISILVTSITLRFLIARNLFSHALFLPISLFIALALGGIFRQLIPRLISLKHPERTLLRFLPLLQPFYGTLALIALPLDGLGARWRREEQLAETSNSATEEAGNANGGAATSEDVQAFIDIGAEEGIIEEEEGELIHSIIEFGDTRVSEVMTPRMEIVAVPITATVREARDVMVESKYSRLPVYRDQIDNIEGIIYVRDLLQAWTEGDETRTIETLLRPTMFVPETKLVSELLGEMQKSHTQMALVIDEYGGVAGLVTVEDILEEIVGEIEDEDTAREDVVEIIEAGEGYYEVEGATEIDKIERLFDVDLSDEDYTTIAGLVISEAGTVPKTGTHLNVRGIDIEVLDADERRINRLRLRRAPFESSAAQAE
jgi:putative hemolysin